MAEWTVLIDAEAPAGSECDAEEVLEQVVELAYLLDDYGPATAGNGRSWSARIAIEAPNPVEATEAAMHIVGRAVAKAGLPGWPVAHVEVTLWERFEAEVSRPNFPDLIGSQEVAEILGVSRQRLHELRGSGRFPEPIVTLAATPVWLRPAVASFLDSWQRRPGRPKTA